MHCICANILQVHIIIYLQPHTQKNTHIVMLSSLLEKEGEGPLVEVQLSWRCEEGKETSCINNLEETIGINHRQLAPGQEPRPRVD